MKSFIQFTSKNLNKSNFYYLSFHLNESLFAANFPKIYGFAIEYNYYPINNKWSDICGVAEVNQQLIPVLNLTKKLGYTESFNNNSKLMILEQKAFDTTFKFAIPYKKIGEAFEIKEEKIVFQTNEAQIFKSGYIKGIHHHNEEYIFIIDFEKLLSLDDLIDIKVSPHYNKKTLVV